MCIDCPILFPGNKQASRLVTRASVTRIMYSGNAFQNVDSEIYLSHTTQRPMGRKWRCAIIHNDVLNILYVMSMNSGLQNNIIRQQTELQIYGHHGCIYNCGGYTGCWMWPCDHSHVPGEVCGHWPAPGHKKLSFVSWLTSPKVRKINSHHRSKNM